MDAKLVIVGGPSGQLGQETLDALHVTVEGLGLEDRVIFRPPQPHELLSSYYRAADVTVCPSRSESFGLVALESAACGTPVVASAVGGLTTLVDEGETGHLIESTDPADYAAAIADVVSSSDRELALSAASVLRARRYTWRSAAVQLSELTETLISRRLVACS